MPVIDFTRWERFSDAQVALLNRLFDAKDWNFFKGGVVLSGGEIATAKALERRGFAEIDPATLKIARMTGDGVRLCQHGIGNKMKRLELDPVDHSEENP